MSDLNGAEAAARGLCSGLQQHPATRHEGSPIGFEHPASHGGACKPSCRCESSSGGSGSAADSTAIGDRQGIAGQGLEPAGQSGCRAGEAVNGQGDAGLGSGAGFVPARTAEYLEPGFWQRRFERGDAHEWFGGYAAFRALLAPRLTPGRCCVLLPPVLRVLCLHVYISLDPFHTSCLHRCNSANNNNHSFWTAHALCRWWFGGTPHKVCCRVPVGAQAPECWCWAAARRRCRWTWRPTALPSPRQTSRPRPSSACARAPQRWWALFKPAAVSVIWLACGACTGERKEARL